MRFLHLTPFYPAHIAALYADNPALADLPYADQHAAVLADGFHWANGLFLELRQHGYETRHHITNIAPLQQAWAREHGIAYDAENWESQIALAQVRAFQPNILYANLSPEFIAAARDAAPSIRLVMGWAGEAKIEVVRFRQHNLVLTCGPENVTISRDAGLQADLLHHAFYPAVLERIGQIEKTVTAGFIGNMVYGDYYHTRRAQFFDALLQSVDVTLYGTIDRIEIATDDVPSLRSVARQSYFTALTGLHRAGLTPLARALPRGDFVLRREDQRANQPIFDRLRVVAQSPVFGMAMYRQLAAFKICVNTHAWSAYASNMRLYEATGVQTCLLTDWKQNIGELFEPDQEIVTYRSPQEAAEKIRYLRQHDAERQAIAAAGQKRTLRDHTLAKRTAQLDAILRHHMD